MQCKMYCSQWNDMSFPIHTVPCHIVLVGLLIENKSFQFKTLPMLDWNVSLLSQVWNWDKSNCQAFPKTIGNYLHILWAIPEKIQKMRPWNFQGIEEQMGIPGIKWKRVEFSSNPKKSCGISMDFVFWSWNSERS